MANPSPIASRIPDPPGTLLTREQRSARAAELIQHALTLALVDHGWKIHVEPGECLLENENGSTMNPSTTAEGLRNGSLGAEQWLRYCETCGIGDWPLAPEVATGAH